MKKNLLGWLAMAAMLVSTGCSTDEVVNDFSEGNAIQFGTYVGRNSVSRATVIDNQKLGTDGFGVFAYYTQTGDFVPDAVGGATPSEPNFMYNEQVTNSTWDETNKNFTGAWTYEPLKYWPNNAGEKLSFFAYAPWQERKQTNESADNFTFNDGSGLPTIQFAVNGTVKDQEDLLWAEPKLNLVKQPAAGATDAGIDVNDKVTFEFKHALSRIGFQVQTMIDKVNDDDVADDNTNNDEDGTDGEKQNGENLPDETKVVVKKVELSGNFITSGTLKWTKGSDDAYTAAITNTEQNAATSTTYTLEAEMGTGDGAKLETNFAAENQTYSLGAKDDKVTVYGQSVNQTEEKLNADDSYIMIIPQSFTGENKLTIKVYYDVITADANLTSGYSQVSNEISTSFSGVEFAAGKAYTFSLHLGLTSVKLEATVNGWDETNGKDWAVNVPLNIEDDDQTGGTGGEGSN